MLPRLLQAAAAPGADPCNIVVIYTLGSHQLAAIRQMIKHWMRSAKKRTVEDTWRHIALSNARTISPMPDALPPNR
jgi:hypothetical protein